MVADHRRENEEMLAKMSSEVEVELETSAQTMRQAITSFSTDVMAEIEKLRETSASSIQESKDESMKMFNGIGDGIAKVNATIVFNDTATKEIFNGMKMQQQHKQDEESTYRDSVQLVLETAALTTCMSDMISTIENSSVVDTMRSAEEQLAATTATIAEETRNAALLATTQMTDLTTMVNEKTNKVQEDIAVFKLATASRLDQGVASAVTDQLTATVVEQTIQERIAALEMDTTNRLKAMEEAEEEKVQRVNATLATIDAQVQQAKEDRSRLEARVESVVGQVEEERNNSELEWQKSLSEAQREDDIAADDGVAADDGGSMPAPVVESGSLPTVDVGFPPPSEDLNDEE